MKNYINFINEKLNINQDKYLTTIIKYLKKNANFDIFEYDEEFEIKKENNEILTGKLYLIPENKAVRFNFNVERLVSIDTWENFKFDPKTLTNKPDYTLILEGSVIKVLPEILSFIKGDLKMNENDNNSVVVEEAPKEKVELKTLNINEAVFKHDIDVFESIKLYTAQVAYKISNSLVISGLPGLGKTTDVEKTLDEIRVDYVPVAGDITTSGLYEILFLNRDKLLLFDDMDSVFKTEESLNLLKAVLDTKPKRKVSRILKTHFDSFGMSDEDVERKYNELGKLPKQFEFTGRIIFITNKSGEELDDALISRSLFVDVSPGFDEVIKRIRKIMPRINQKIALEIKENLLDFMVLMSNKYDLRFPLNLRTFVHCLNIRISNEFNMNIAGENIPAWQMLIKSYLVKKVNT